MTYEAIETGPLGKPVEMYEFSQAGVFTRVTSAATDQSIGAVAFPTLAGLSRTEFVESQEATSGETVVTVPSNFIIASQFRGTIPSSLPSLTIFAKHLNDPADQTVTIWKGTVVSCAFGDRDAKLSCMPPTRRFSRQIPRVVYSGICNHQLYDNGCLVNRQSFKFSGTLTTVDSIGTTLTIAGLRDRAAAIVTDLGLTRTAQQIDDFWQRGVISTLITPGEVRGIVESDVAGNPDTVRIAIPFRESVTGVNIEVFAGCDHFIITCRDKFLNFVIDGDTTSGLRFGGFPEVPTKNPFEIDLDSGRADRSTRRVSPFSRSRL